MFGPQVLDRAGRLLRAQNRLDGQVARAVREGELTQAAEHDGPTTMQSWLRGHARLSPAAAHRVVRTGRALEHLPAVAAAFAAGRVTAEQVAVIAPVARDEHRAAATEQDVDLVAVDVLLAETASTRPHRELAQVVHHYLVRLDPDGPEPDPTEMRSLTLARHPDGSVTGRFELDAIGGEKVQAALESMLQASRPAGDIRNRSQQLGDAFVQWADNTLAAGHLPILRTVKPHVIVTIPLADLVDPHAGPGAAQTGFGARISAGRARWLACDGNVTRVVIGPESQPLEMGRSHRVVPPHLRRATETRDRHCVFAGCLAPSYWCDVHHLLHWIDGGETTLDNSALLCESHHTKVHHGFRVERQPDGRWRTWRPDGTEIVLHPYLLSA
ncbi:HNH endonuclease [Blastococcus sp. CT_GayMR16]|nr:HNH endonuclease signature motif containing protein [Blastococcus sp. CT_GayMR16]TFV87658.1 HNH endonuclease [Blastococcus sp. CT_GayMR16]